MKRKFAVRELTRFHASEQVEILFDAFISVWTWLTGLFDGPAVFSHLLFVQTANIRLTFFEWGQPQNRTSDRSNQRREIVFTPIET